VDTEQLLNVSDYERAAEEKLDPAAFGYFAGGANDEWTLFENIEAFDRWVLRPRVLVDVSGVTAATSVLGTEVSFPVLVAPMAFQGLAHPDGEKAMARGAATAGTIMCLSTLSTVGIEEVAEAAPHGARWFQLYWGPDRARVQDLVERAAAAGYGAIVVTVDLPEVGRRERDLRTGFEAPVQLADVVDNSLTWRDLEWLRARISLPLLLKGVLTAEDAALACEAGVEGLVVSNHGGRQLDGVAATLDALPEVVEAVEDRAEVLVDSGVRRGTDVVKALALGARAVLAGRAPLWGLAVGGAEGVERVLGLLRDEFELALALCGCAAPAEVTRAHVAAAAGSGLP
jgi:isopentenyl diphosphate isomerase/L-lactate dehydrogenase-like FMN-dependent dehydrogenase